MIVWFCDIVICEMSHDVESSVHKFTEIVACKIVTDLLLLQLLIHVHQHH